MADVLSTLSLLALPVAGVVLFTSRFKKRNKSQKRASARERAHARAAQLPQLHRRRQPPVTLDAAAGATAAASDAAGSHGPASSALGRQPQDQERTASSSTVAEEDDVIVIPERDHVMHVLQEEEMDELHDSSGAGQAQMMQMLQRLGFKVMIPPGSNGQITMLPPNVGPETGADLDDMYDPDDDEMMEMLGEQMMNDMISQQGFDEGGSSRPVGGMQDAFPMGMLGQQMYGSDGSDDDEGFYDDPSLIGDVLHSFAEGDELDEGEYDEDEDEYETEDEDGVEEVQ